MSRTHPTKVFCHNRPNRRGFSLLELVVAVAIMSLLLLGMGSAVMIAIRSLDTGGSRLAETLVAREITDQITRDLHFATSFITRTDTEVVFTVPDRDGFGGSEVIKYKWFGTPGGPPGSLQRRYNGGTPVTLADNVTNFNLSYLYRTLAGMSVSSADPEILLLVVLDASNLTTQETQKKTLIASWGYTVHLISASEVQVNFDAAVAEVDVVYVVEQGQSTILGTKLRNAAIGVCNEEVELRNQFGFSANRSWSAPTNALSIMNNLHYITSPFNMGRLTICSSNQSIVTLAGIKAGGLEVLGEFNHSGPRPGLSVIDTGGTLYGGGTAAGRRVQMPWGHAGFDINALNANGLTLMARTIAWAAKNEQSVSTTAVFGINNAFSIPGCSVHDIQITANATLPENGTVSSVCACAGGSNKEVRYAIYTDSGGEPDKLVVELMDQAAAISDDWVAIPVPVTAIAAGTYGLTLSRDQTGHRYYQDSGGAACYRSHDI